jgi:hypothetical protein
MRAIKFLAVVPFVVLIAAQAAAAVWKVAPKKTRFWTGPYAQTFVNNDWRRGVDKSECGQTAGNFYNTMVGISLHEEESCGLFTGCWRVISNPSILCSTSDLQVFMGGGVRVLEGQAGARRDTSLGDWAFGFHKLECGPREVMTGLADGAAMCSPVINTLGAKNCNVRWFLDNNNRGTTTRGDWSVGNRKGECALGEYIKGVALSSASMAILCCSPSF